jgi:hypothetical protein
MCTWGFGVICARVAERRHIVAYFLWVVLAHLTRSSLGGVVWCEIVLHFTMLNEEVLSPIVLLERLPMRDDLTDLPLDVVWHVD